MKMPIEEIFDKYNFKSKELEILTREMIECLRRKAGSQEYIVYINKILSTNADFNMFFSEIVDYYGHTFSDELDKRLKFTEAEMERCMMDFNLKHNEKKLFNNRISFLAGALAAIILI